MKKINYYVDLSDEERRLLIEGLIFKKNRLIEQGRYTDGVDDVLLKVICAGKKKFKIK